MRSSHTQILVEAEIQTIRCAMEQTQKPLQKKLETSETIKKKIEMIAGTVECYSPF